MENDPDYQMALRLQEQFDAELHVENPPRDFVLDLNKKLKMENDPDYQMALRLQEQFHEELHVENPPQDLTCNKKENIKEEKSVIDPSWELKPNLKIENDPDYHMAFRLQEQFDTELHVENPPQDLTCNKNINEEKSVIDPSWEIIDPIPDKLTLFRQFNKQFFWNKLNSVVFRWSHIMTKRAATFYKYKFYKEGQGGDCSIALSKPILQFRPRRDLVETLLHEMIHAYLFVTSVYETEKHGPEYLKHMNRINAEAGTNIRVRHYFPDEVDLHKLRCWKCDGPCRKRTPYYGKIVRSKYNAPVPKPGRNDPWIDHHQRTCGGTFQIVETPEKKKKKTVKNNNEFNETTKTKPVDGNKLSGEEQIQTKAGLETRNINDTIFLNPKKSARSNYLPELSVTPSCSNLQDFSQESFTEVIYGSGSKLSSNSNKRPNNDVPGPSTGAIKKRKNETITSSSNINSSTQTLPVNDNKVSGKENKQTRGGLATKNKNDRLVLKPKNSAQSKDLPVLSVTPSCSKVHSFSQESSRNNITEAFSGSGSKLSSSTNSNKTPNNDVPGPSTGAIKKRISETITSSSNINSSIQTLPVNDNKVSGKENKQTRGGLATKNKNDRLVLKPKNSAQSKNLPVLSVTPSCSKVHSFSKGVKAESSRNNIKFSGSGRIRVLSSSSANSNKKSDALKNDRANKFSDPRPSNTKPNTKSRDFEKDSSKTDKKLRKSYNINLDSN